MAGGIFLIQHDGQLVEMTEAPYDSESLLQELLATYPSVLAGDQINAGSPRKWLLIRREMGIPGESGGNRWSVDHLFLDQDAVPTLVEVKRSSDTRIRREVVGQMLDYAANAVVYWPVEDMRVQFEKRCEAGGVDAQESLYELLRDEADQEHFWQKVKTNLKAGRIRMVFVADEIPTELQRVVEFLNEQMEFAEVLALEVKQYVGQGLKTLVPRLIGRTAEADSRKGTSALPEKQWDEASFFQALEEKRGSAEAEIAKQILAWAKPKATRIWWGKGKIEGSLYPMFDDERGKQPLISVWTNGRIEVEFGYMKSRPPFSDEQKRRELLRRLNAVLAIPIPDEGLERFPKFAIELLTGPGTMNRFLEVLDWAVAEIRGRPGEAPASIQGGVSTLRPRPE